MKKVQALKNYKQLRAKILAIPVSELSDFLSSNANYKHWLEEAIAGNPYQMAFQNMANYQRFLDSYSTAQLTCIWNLIKEDADAIFATLAENALTVANYTASHYRQQFESSIVGTKSRCIELSALLDLIKELPYSEQKQKINHATITNYDGLCLSVVVGNDADLINDILHNTDAGHFGLDQLIDGLNACTKQSTFELILQMYKDDIEHHRYYINLLNEVKKYQLCLKSWVCANFITSIAKFKDWQEFVKQIHGVKDISLKEWLSDWLVIRLKNLVNERVSSSKKKLKLDKAELKALRSYVIYLYGDANKEAFTEWLEEIIFRETLPDVKTLKEWQLLVEQLRYISGSLVKEKLSHQAVVVLNKLITAIENPHVKTKESLDDAKIAELKACFDYLHGKDSKNYFNYILEKRIKNSSSVSSKVIKSSSKRDYENITGLENVTQLDDYLKSHGINGLELLLKRSTIDEIIIFVGLASKHEDWSMIKGRLVACLGDKTSMVSSLLMIMDKLCQHPGLSNLYLVSMEAQKINQLIASHLQGLLVILKRLSNEERSSFLNAKKNDFSTYFKVKKNMTQSELNNLYDLDRLIPDNFKKSKQYRQQKFKLIHYQKRQGEKFKFFRRTEIDYEYSTMDEILEHARKHPRSRSAKILSQVTCGN